jgi:hypothetical protein
MRDRRKRTVIALLWISATAFYCVPHPNIKVDLVEVPEMRTGVVTEPTVNFEHVAQLVSVFGKRFQLSATPCSSTWDWGTAQADQCLSLERFKDEGITVAAFRDSNTHQVRIVLVKELRLFSQFPRNVVEAAFDAMVVFPLQEKLGETRVHVQRR